MMLASVPYINGTGFVLLAGELGVDNSSEQTSLSAMNRL